MFFAFRVPVGRFAKKTTLFLGAIFMPVIMLGEAEVLDIVLAFFFFRTTFLAAAVIRGNEVVVVKH